MTPDQKRMTIELLKDEYLLLQKFYEDFDGRIVTIKGWSATIGLTAIGTGFYQSPYLWLFGAISGVVFWYIEALWMSFQYMYGPRIRVSRKHFRKAILMTSLQCKFIHHGSRPSKRMDLISGAKPALAS
jgi:hypothetical protein